MSQGYVGQSGPSRFSRGLAQAFSTESMISTLKTLAWLAPLTVLIWIYAEREQIVIAHDEPIAIELEQLNPNRKATIRGIDNDRAFLVELQGPQGRISQLRQAIASQKRPVVTIRIDPNLAPGRAHELDVTSLLLASEVFQRSGVAIISSKPARVSVYVDEIVRQEVEVKVPPEVTNLEGAATFTPARIVVQATRSALPSNGEINLYANLAATGKLSQQGLQTDVPVSVGIPGIANEDVQFEPNTVKATFTVRAFDQVAELPSMPIWGPSLPLPLLKGYVVETSADSLSNVPVIGPPEKIAYLLNPESQKPIARIIISLPTDTDGRSRPAKLVYEFPPQAEGVKVKPEFTPTIEYKLTKREQ
jgi:hypothetical protein